MASIKRNTFLDDGESDDDDHSQFSDVSDQGRGALAARATKRRRLHFERDDELDLASDDDDGDALEEEAELSVHELEAGDTENTIDEVQDRTQSKRSTPKSVAKAEKAKRKSGVVYISRIPPFMKPHTLKNLLAPHASKGLGRIFLTPEDREKYISRKKQGGNKKKSFTDGWVEFVSKTEAKAAADTLNGNIIGGKKRGYYHDDIWNIKYLSAFKWSHLTEQIDAENAERAARLREEVRKTKEENKAFAEDFERGKRLDLMDKKRKERGESPIDRTESGGPARDIRQSQAKHAGGRSKGAEAASVQRTLSMIF